MILVSLMIYAKCLNQNNKEGWFSMSPTLNIERFINLKKRDTGDNDSCNELDICLQSIHRGLEYCKYHFVLLAGSVEGKDLALDRISNGYRRPGDPVPLRYIYEANISAFLSSLHALLDSFPYLLNLFIPVIDNAKAYTIGWKKDFVKKYKNYDFYDDIERFFIDCDFNKVKGYVNTLKHKHHIRILNKYDHLEFEEYSYQRRFTDCNKGFVEEEKSINGLNVATFIEDCHNNLIPKLFSLCDSILDCQERSLDEIETK